MDVVTDAFTASSRASVQRQEAAAAARARCPSPHWTAWLAVCRSVVLGCWSAPSSMSVTRPVRPLSSPASSASPAAASAASSVSSAQARICDALLDFSIEQGLWSTLAVGWAAARPFRMSPNSAAAVQLSHTQILPLATMFCSRARLVGQPPARVAQFCRTSAEFSSTLSAAVNQFCRSSTPITMARAVLLNWVTTTRIRVAARK